MKNLAVLVLVVVAFVALLPAGVGAMQDSAAQEVRVKPRNLPQPVKAAIKENCPRCVIAKATREVEEGVTVYDIEFKGRGGEIDIAEDGTVIDREVFLNMDGVPLVVQKTIREAAAGARITQLDRSEIRAELKGGQITKREIPKFVYEAELAKGKEVAELLVSASGEVIEALEWKPKSAREN